jgi:tetratricopeptide (TPR) repeat protein
MEKPAKKPRRRLALAGLLLLLAGGAGLFWQDKLVAWIYGPESGVRNVTLGQSCDMSIADDLVIRACHSQRADGSLLCEKETLQAALRICPEHPEANNNLADLLEREGELEQAVKHYQIALKTADYQFSEAWYGLGRTYGKQQQPGLSLYAYVHACTAKPEARAAVKALVAQQVSLSDPAQKAEVDRLLAGCV